jgi:hypothetical protein
VITILTEARPEVGATFGANWRGKVRQSIFPVQVDWRIGAPDSVGAEIGANWRTKTPRSPGQGARLKLRPLSGHPASAFVAGWRIVALPAITDFADRRPPQPAGGRHTQEKTMTNEDLDGLEIAAYLCDGENVDYFAETVLPKLSSLAEGDLLALAGKFLDRKMFDTGGFIAVYARAAGTGMRPDTRRFWEEWRALQKKVVDASR